MKIKSYQINGIIKINKIYIVLNNNKQAKKSIMIKINKIK